MTNEKLKFLVNYLLSERNDLGNLNVPEDEEELFRLYRKHLGKKPAEERQCYDKMLDMFGMNNIRILTVSSAKSGLNLHCFIGEFENILCNLTKFYLYA